MIARYTRKEMGLLWDEKHKFETWLNVELAVLKVLENDKVIPSGTVRIIKGKAKVNVERIRAIEQTTRHDVIAFSTSIAEQCGERGRYFHYGLTSSDVVDTAFALTLRCSLDLILETVSELEEVLEKLARKYQKLVCIGRTHGIHAEPTSFGLKFLGWLELFRRERVRLLNARDQISFGKLSGAVGSYGIISPKQERAALELLDLSVEPVSTQIVPRDRHAEVFFALASLGGAIEKVSVDLRHLQRTEVHEVEEGFAQGQKGSSAMPHKKNPISAENLTGCSRLLRGYAVAAFENVALWHERDISHSSVERVITPDATILADYMVSRLTAVLKNIVVRKDNVAKNLQQTQGIYFSGHVLIELTKRGLSREQAYALVQKAAHSAWEKKRWFGDELLKLSDVRNLISSKELNRILKTENYLIHVEQIYARVLSSRKKKK